MAYNEEFPPGQEHFIKLKREHSTEHFIKTKRRHSIGHTYQHNSEGDSILSDKYGCPAPLRPMPPAPLKKHTYSTLSEESYTEALLAPASLSDNINEDILSSIDINNERQQSEAYLSQTFKEYLAAFPQHLIGPLSDTKQTLPTAPLGPLSDGRRLSWHKYLLDDILPKIVNTSCPTGHGDCWMVPMASGDTSGYIIKKFASRGEGNKHQLHKVFYHIMTNTSADNIPNGHDYAHRCGRGRYDQSKGILFGCINPYHIVICGHSINIEHNYCRNGEASLCPHNPKCIYTDSKGKHLPCRNSLTRLAGCECGRGDCFANNQRN